MSEQYTPNIESAQAYLSTLRQETITLQSQEITRLRRDLAQAQATITKLGAYIRDLEIDNATSQPRQGYVGAPMLQLRGLTKTKQVEQLAVATGVSVSTMWRRVQKGEVALVEV